MDILKTAGIRQSLHDISAREVAGSEQQHRTKSLAAYSEAVFHTLSEYRSLAVGLRNKVSQMLIDQ